MWAASKHSALREAIPRQHSEGKSIDEHVCRPEQVPQPLPTLRCLQLHRQWLLPVIGLGVEELTARSVLRHDLDDRRPMVSERPSDNGGCDHVREVDNNHV